MDVQDSASQEMLSDRDVFDTLQPLGYISQRGCRLAKRMAINILIADDYEDNRELLSLLLRAAAFEVFEARDGAECLMLATKELPDLIMIDLSMPVLDGWGVFQRLKADERTASIPCVAVTAHADTDRDRALAAGFSAYISKPFRGGELIEIVRGLVPTDKTKGQMAQLEN
jgi:two-component system, cell cycle response regulator DivK